MTKFKFLITVTDRGEIDNLAFPPGLAGEDDDLDGGGKFVYHEFDSEENARKEEHWKESGVSILLEEHCPFYKNDDEYLDYNIDYIGPISDEEAQEIDEREILTHNFLGGL